MGKIVRLNRRHLNKLAKIDIESEHQMDKLANLNLFVYKGILLERFKQGNEIFFGYKEDGILKGYATLILNFPGHKHCECYWLAVGKGHQGLGIGSKLMKHVEVFAKKKGFRKVCLYTNKLMRKTRKFYEKIGYKLINEFPGYYGYQRNNTAVLYAKIL